jgi:hypothetical protein
MAASKGGKARAAKLSPAKREQIVKKAAAKLSAIIVSKLSRYSVGYFSIRHEAH